MINANPKIIHRIYFPEFRPFQDPFLHYLETWKREMPEYEIKLWNSSNLDVNANDWTRRAYADGAPVFLSEYFRWQVLEEFGGLYLDADCEVLDGSVLNNLVEELYTQEEYDTFFGVEELANGYPTAQTVGARQGSELVQFMRKMYDVHLSGPLWHWRERRSLIGPQLMALFFLDRNTNKADDGYFKNIENPVVVERCKVYPQTYFSPKFGMLGETLNYRHGQTCVYHMFANTNLDFGDKPTYAEEVRRPLMFGEYQDRLAQLMRFPRVYDAATLETRIGALEDEVLVATTKSGVLSFGPHITLPKGAYTILVNGDFEGDNAEADIRVTVDGGARTIGKLQMKAGQPRQGIMGVQFHIERELERNVEFLIEVFNVEKASLKSIELRQGAVLAEATKPSLKILHRIYFGFDGKPDPFRSYLDSWQEQLPDFEIKHWNASNLPMDGNAYVRELYTRRDHTFLSDYFRWYVLREYGGTYLDADVEVVDGTIFRALIEELDEATGFDAFIGIDEVGGGWYTAHSMASKPQSEFTRFMCDTYEKLQNFAVWQKKGFYFWAPQMAALYFANAGHHVGGMGTTPHLEHPIVAGRVKIYPQDWFSPISPTGRVEEPFKINGVSNNTCLCHHFACTWHDEDSMYVDHAKESGGQSGMRLKERIAKSRTRKFSAKSAKLGTNVGLRKADKLRSTSRAGYLVFGPYIDLPTGHYRASIGLVDVERWGRVLFDVVSQSGNKRHFKRDLKFEDVSNGRVYMTFTLESDITGVEFRLHIDKLTTLAFTDIAIEYLVDARSKVELIQI